MSGTSGTSGNAAPATSRVWPWEPKTFIPTQPTTYEHWPESTVYEATIGFNNVTARAVSLSRFPFHLLKNEVLGTRYCIDSPNVLHILQVQHKENDNVIIFNEEKTGILKDFLKQVRPTPELRREMMFQLVQALHFFQKRNFRESKNIIHLILIINCQ